MADFRVKRGHDVPMVGAAPGVLVDAVKPRQVSVRPGELRMVAPELVIREGEVVSAGQPLFQDQRRPEILFVSPAGGRAYEVRRGLRGTCEEILIEVSERESMVEWHGHAADEARSITRGELVEILLRSGLWPSLRRRPYSVIPDPDAVPDAIFVAASDNDPLPFDYSLALEAREEDFQLGLELLGRLTEGAVHVCVLEGRVPETVAQARHCERHTFAGPYPAGRIETQIHYVMPCRRGQEVWYLDAQDCADVGETIRTGCYPVTRIVAVGGEGATRPGHYRTRRAIPVSFLDPDASPAANRFISGGPLTGIRVGADSGLGLYDNKFSIVPEGNEPEFIGWMLPGFDKVSRFPAYASAFRPPRHPHVTTNLGGRPHAPVITGIHEDVCAVDVLPLQLMNSILAGNAGESERLGLADCAECGLCTYVCPSKLELGEIISAGIRVHLEEEA